ncbi:alpha-ketoglutarate-dependent dioxygenase alkB homolog 4 [Bombina bombina]|uniref:alpha-ketoglutarate-dependent dioxygenase alkB homolog 4 n=1 Tax=Bombina bombina TaxID=8345 RepID=UPI00235AB7EA|nr:alpha-ketoglutarate-dependent dioxygenase alkB homolog 4 [Bombina bombina]
MATVPENYMDSCGCKGIRSCLLCERPGLPDRGLLQHEPHKRKSFIYNPADGVAVGIKNTESDGYWFPFPGVCLIPDFVTEEEEKEMVNLMDKDEWKLSQSGRRKQDYGPKVNFKKQKLKLGNFTGLPSFSQVLWQRMKPYSALEGFMPVEQCNLDYNSDRGSAIDPHFDDSWLWGERLVSLNLLSKTVLTMTCDSLDTFQLMPLLEQRTESNNGITSNLKQSHNMNITQPFCHVDNKLQTNHVPYGEVEVAICLPQRSLVVLYGDARYKWKHAIRREYIENRRICCTFRELSEEFSAGGKEEKLGHMLLQIAIGFQGKSV